MSKQNNLPVGPQPKVGDVIYVHTSLSIGHGQDDTRGGKATISHVEANISAGEPTWFVSFQEIPGAAYNYSILLEEQDKLRAQFGNNVAHPDPDYTDYDEPV